MKPETEPGTNDSRLVTPPPVRGVDDHRTSFGSDEGKGLNDQIRLKERGCESVEVKRKLNASKSTVVKACSVFAKDFLDEMFGKHISWVCKTRNFDHVDDFALH